jgi:acyl-CoA synthetase (NDP forming)
MKKLLLELCSEGHQAGRDMLLEPELYSLLAHGGLTVPDHYVLSANPANWPGELKELPGDRVVLKVISPEIVHKTELGGVRIAANRPDDILAAAQEIVATVRKRGGKKLGASIIGIMVAEFVSGEARLGGQLLAGLRWTRDMGHVITIGFGGLDAEELAAAFLPGEATTLYSPELMTPEEGLDKFKRSFAYRLVAGQARSGRKLLDDQSLLRLLTFFHNVANRFSNQPTTNWTIAELEVNPFLLRDGDCVAVDAFCRFSAGHEVESSVDVEKVRTLLEPRTAAIVGVSASKMNVGRVVLGNLLREGFPAEQIRVVRSGQREMDGVQCVDSIADLPWVAELLVLTVGAKQVGSLMREVMASQRATGVVIIAGGMGETEGGKREEEELDRMLVEARARSEWAPVVVGPNCLGICSKPGKYDTLFIPEQKLARPHGKGKVKNVALICQSGAFMVTRMDGLGSIEPIYAISTGNQLDLSLTDFAQVVLDDDDVDVLALYIEGFHALGGLRLARLVRQARAGGKEIIVYKAGRTGEGLTASSSHTASISSDYRACTEVLGDAGAYIAQSFNEFTALMNLAALLHRFKFQGRGLAALSNAGFEAVGMADSLEAKGGFTLPGLAPATQASLHKVLEAASIDSLVTIRNPLDITPMAPDQVYGSCLDSLLSDPSIGAAIVGVVPHTPSLKSLPPGIDDSGQDSLDNPHSLHQLLPQIVERHQKPVVTVVDAGRGYDALAEALNRRGLPCFRSADSALRYFQLYLNWHSPGVSSRGRGVAPTEGSLGTTRNAKRHS